jgi:hypothetical protein
VQAGQVLIKVLAAGMNPMDRAMGQLLIPPLGSSGTYAERQDRNRRVTPRRGRHSNGN